LGEIGPEAKDAVPTLSSALSNADASTRSAIESALRKIDANR